MGITKAMRRAVLGAATIGALAVPASAFGAATLTIANGDAALTAAVGDIDTITVTSSPSDVKLSDGVGIVLGAGTAGVCTLDLAGVATCTYGATFFDDTAVDADDQNDTVTLVGATTLSAGGTT